MAVYILKTEITDPDVPGGGSAMAQQSVYIEEWDLYGSSRLGTIHTYKQLAWKDGIYEYESEEFTPNDGDPYEQTALPATNIVTYFVGGNKNYELSNHLGNVLATIKDRKVPTISGTSFTYFNAQATTVTDYYPFGMQIEERSWVAASSKYRFGFNGKENDNEVKGEGNQQDYGMRIYDTRLGKFLSVDPLTRSYPWYTPYQFAGNKPIWAIDLDGLEEYYTTSGQLIGQVGTSTDKRVLNGYDYWTAYKDAKSAADNLAGTIEKATANQNKLDASLKALTENSIPLYTDVKDALHAWGEVWRPQSANQEYGATVYSKSFKDSKGNYSFTGYVLGATVTTGLKNEVDKEPIDSRLVIGSGTFVYRYRLDNLNARTVNIGGWTMAASVHTHPASTFSSTNTDFSPEDGNYSFEFQIDTYMIQFNSTSLFFFNRAYYNKTTAIPWRYSATGAWEGMFDEEAFKEASDKTLDFFH